MAQLSLADPSIFYTPFPETSLQSGPRHLDASQATTVRPQQSVRMHPPGPVETLPLVDKFGPYTATPEDLIRARRHLRKESPRYAQLCDEAKKAVEADPRSASSRNRVGDDILITTLGTGSAIPSKYRNVSATLVSIPTIGHVLLDCGEGSLGQLRRMFGKEGLKQVYSELKMIFISHMHADHHLGLQAILEDRFAVSDFLLHSSWLTGRLDSPLHCTSWDRPESPWVCKNRHLGSWAQHEKHWKTSFSS